MKNTLKLISLLVFAALAAASCEDKNFGHDKGTGAAPTQITNLSSEEVRGGILLKWKNPDDPNFEYVRVECDLGNGQKVTQTVSKYSKDEEGFSFNEMDCFPEKKEYTFNLYACNSKGAAGKPVSLTAVPDDPVFLQVAPTVDVTADLNSILVTWKNEYKKPLLVDISYVEEGTSNLKVISLYSDSINGSQEIPFDKEESGVNYIVEVLVKDRFNNAATPSEFTAKPIKADWVKLKRTDWEFPGYDEKSQDGKLGYSSQATNEGDAPKGRVAAILDEDVNTFWHSAYSPQASFPHFFIIDFKEEIEFRQIGITRRQDDNGKKAQKGQFFAVCTDAGAVDKEKSDDWSWREFGYQPFDIENINEQIYYIGSTGKVRYLKVYFTEKECKGEEKNVMVADLQLYNLVPVEE